ncbi:MULTISPECIES: Yip1 family protein [unclassified Streptomyces]|uniref:Yip1 family protein n=1 Tax=unclassified Streptomyces TaxID=2593676 RepID=UPI002DD983FB|nr:MULTISPECIES: Yip1 family protein [unclassified Streptomyces]WSA93500.1 YIP1 family protein [Streptomyces sp. NBC_01795]WSB77870.1 YIP1 family protein [Streptomyces sp. NBC_01775]WSS13883.1 YIP1 family protein [Streptomyces sp. NBC_01186]WSS42697.1 YIP1 family protein [Streptomyces sp. NBC_01187]
MAGFRSGRGRDSRGAQQHGHSPQHPQGSPYPQQGRDPGPWQGGRAPGGAPGPGPGPGQGPGPGPYGPRGGPDEPEYFGDPHPPQYGAPPHGQGPYGPGAGGHDPYANNPGSTQSFSVPDPYGPGGPQGPDPYGDDGYGGNAPAPPSGPRLHWKALLSGIVLHPNATFWQMRDYAVWGPALIVTFLYGLLAVFGLDKAREDVINTTIGQAIPYVLTTGVAVVIAGLILGAVTHTLARQFGGNGAWQPTVGLAMLIMSLTDAPRLLFALFLGGNAGLVQILGWATWVLSGVLFTSMVSRSHELPWPRALGASAIQLLALLFLIKLGTL